jgi:hypothetical protein
MVIYLGLTPVVQKTTVLRALTRVWIGVCATTAFSVTVLAANIFDAVCCGRVRDAVARWRALVVLTIGAVGLVHLETSPRVARPASPF